MERKARQTSAAMAGMSVRSVRKWQWVPLPSETGQERWWRTRTDPFDGVWEEEILPLLEGEAAGRLRATTIIEWLEEKFPDRFSASQLRTLQRRLQDWGTLNGPEQEVYLPPAEQVDACSTRWVAPPAAEQSRGPASCVPSWGGPAGWL